MDGWMGGKRKKRKVAAGKGRAGCATRAESDSGESLATRRGHRNYRGVRTGLDTRGWVMDNGASIEIKYAVVTKVSVRYSTPSDGKPRLAERCYLPSYVAIYVYLVEEKIKEKMKTKKSRSKASAAPKVKMGGKRGREKLDGSR